MSDKRTILLRHRIEQLRKLEIERAALNSKRMKLISRTTHECSVTTIELIRLIENY